MNSEKDDGKVVPIGTKKRDDDQNHDEDHLTSANPRIAAALRAMSNLSVDELAEVLNRMPKILDDVAARNGLPKKE